MVTVRDTVSLFAPWLGATRMTAGAEQGQTLVESRAWNEHAAPGGLEKCAVTATSPPEADSDVGARESVTVSLACAVTGTARAMTRTIRVSG